MAATRVCSECPSALPADAPKVQKTCTAACRAKRSRRLKKVRSEAGQNRAGRTPEQVALAEAASTNKEVAHQVAAEELRPIIREAITEDVLKAVKDLVGLTPAMVEAIQDDIMHGEPEIRQRAYTLLAKYTLGNPSVMPKSAEAQPAPMQVVFNMPRPGDITLGTEGAAPLEASAVEVKDCSECATPTPIDDFVAGSDRCQTCHDKLQEQVRARFA